MEFVTDNIIWFIAGGLILVMTIVGYYAEKTDFGRNTDKDKPKKEKKKKNKNESTKDPVLVEENLDNNTIIEESSNSFIDENTIKEVVAPEIIEASAISEGIEDLDSVNNLQENIGLDFDINVDEKINSEEVISEPMTLEETKEEFPIIDEVLPVHIADDNDTKEKTTDIKLEDFPVLDDAIIQNDELVSGVDEITNNNLFETPVLDEPDLNTSLEPKEENLSLLSDENYTNINEEKLENSASEENVSDNIVALYEETTMNDESQEIATFVDVDKVEKENNSKDITFDEPSLEEIEESQTIIGSEETSLSNDDSSEELLNIDEKEGIEEPSIESKEKEPVLEDLKIDKIIPDSKVEKTLSPSEVEIPEVNVDDSEEDKVVIINSDSISVIDELNKSVEKAVVEELEKEEKEINDQILDNAEMKIESSISENVVEELEKEAKKNENLTIPNDETVKNELVGNTSENIVPITEEVKIDIVPVENDLKNEKTITFEEPILDEISLTMDNQIENDLVTVSDLDETSNIEETELELEFPKEIETNINESVSLEDKDENTKEELSIFNNENLKVKEEDAILPLEEEVNTIETDPITNIITPVSTNEAESNIEELPNEAVFDEKKEETKVEEPIVNEVGIADVNIEELPVKTEEEIIVTTVEEIPNTAEIEKVKPKKEKKKKEKKKKTKQPEKKPIFSFGKKKAISNLEVAETKFEPVAEVVSEIKEVPKEVVEEKSKATSTDDDEEIWKF